MKKITILILIVSLLLSFGCNTKKVVKTNYKEELKDTVISKVETKEKEALKTSTDKSTSQVKNEDVINDKTEVEIAGNADKNNPMIYYNVVNGDTIDLFKIVGNADFIFKKSNNTHKSILNNKTTDNTKESKEHEKTISNAVENVKEVVNQEQTKTVDIVKKDFTIGSYIVFMLWGLAIIAILAFIMWLRKSTWWTSIINKFKYNDK